MVTTESEREASSGAGRVRHAARTTARPGRLVPLVLASAFFFAPLGAFVLGQRPVAFENRALAEFPSPSDGW